MAQSVTAARHPTRHENAAPPKTLPLSPDRAFVIQLREGAEVEERIAGRVEHVQSARATRFETLEQLLAFIKLVLGDLKNKSTEQAKRGNEE